MTWPQSSDSAGPAPIPAEPDPSQPGNGHTITLAFVGTVPAETVAANRGIGNVMIIASGNFDVPLVFSGLVILAVMGVMLYLISSWLESRVTGWSQRKGEMAMV